MELLDRYLIRVTLVLALAIYAVASGEISVVASSGRASLIAAVQHTPVVVGLRLELLRGCVTLAVRAQLRQEQDGHTLRQDSAGRGLPIDESATDSLLCRLGGMPSRQHID